MNLEETVEQWTERKCSRFDEEGKTEIIEMIKSILNNNKFLRDPESFILNYTMNRGITQECRFPHDLVFQYLEEKYLWK